MPFLNEGNPSFVLILFPTILVIVVTLYIYLGDFDLMNI